MKKVDDMSIEDMQNYLQFVDNLKRTFGGSYRIFWPFKPFIPFSPSKLMINIGVITSWYLLLFWIVAQPYSTLSFAFILIRFWSVILVIDLFILLLERHSRIKRRYRSLTRSGAWYNIHNSGSTQRQDTASRTGPTTPPDSQPKEAEIHPPGYQTNQSSHASGTSDPIRSPPSQDPYQQVRNLIQKIIR